MYKQLLLIFFFSIPVIALAQKAIDPNKQIDTVGKRDLIDVGKSVFHINPKPDTAKTDTAKNKKGKTYYFSILPLSSAVPGGGRAIFTATTVGFYMGDRNT